MLNHLLKKQSINAFMPFINKFYVFSKYNFNENNKTFNKLMFMTMQNNKDKNQNQNQKLKKNHELSQNNSNEEKINEDIYNQQYQNQSNTNYYYKQTLNSNNSDSNPHSYYNNSHQNNYSKDTGKIFFNDGKYNSSRVEGYNDYKFLEKDFGVNQSTQEKPKISYAIKESPNLLNKKIYYEEQDIMMDPIPKKSDKDISFDKNKDKEKAKVNIKDELKLLNNKILIEELDFNKCELIDLDKKTKEKIINLIFKPKKVLQFSKLVYALSNNGFVIEDDEIQSTENTEFKIKKIRKYNTIKKTKTTQADSNTNLNQQINNFNPSGTIDITQDSETKINKKVKGKVTKKSNLNNKQPSIGTEEENKIAIKKISNPIRKNSEKKSATAINETENKSKNKNKKSPEETISNANLIKKANPKKEIKEIIIMDSPNKKVNKKENSVSHKIINKINSNTITKDILLKKNNDIVLWENFNEERNFIKYLNTLELKSSKDNLFQKNHKEFLRDLFSKFNKVIEKEKLKKPKGLKQANNMDFETFLILRNHKITSTYGISNIKLKHHILFKFNIQFKHIISTISCLKNNKIYYFYSFKYDRENKKGYACFMMFSENFHIGTMICNYGYLENLTNLESIVNLFNLSIVELIETQIKDRIIHFNMISNKDTNFEKIIKKKTNKDNSDLINLTIKNILNAKLQKFKNNSWVESDKTKNSLIKEEETQKFNIPNINFEKQAVFKKSFANFLKIAEGLKDGEILYQI